MQEDRHPVMPKKKHDPASVNRPILRGLTLPKLLPGTGYIERIPGESEQVAQVRHDIQEGKGFRIRTRSRPEQFKRPTTMFSARRGVEARRRRKEKMEARRR